tara:strand:+ start:557 stop:766 length:210 start_codon:yes stop_codon:yes gene_type:complete
MKNHAKSHYFWITTIYENHTKWETRADTFEDMKEIVQDILHFKYQALSKGKAYEAYEVVKFTVEEKEEK